MIQNKERFGRIAALRPDWRRGVTVSYEFKTGIVTAYAGFEQREALRQRARISVEMDALLTRSQIERHMADLAEAQHAPFYFPVPWRDTTLASTAVEGAVSLEVSEAPFWLLPGTDLIVSDEAREAAASVAAVTGTNLALAAPLQAGFGAGATVQPAYRVRAEQEAKFSARVPGVWTGRVRYDVDPGTDPQGVPAASPTLFEGVEVFDTLPDWRQEPSVTLQDFRAVLDHGYGRIWAENPTGRTSVVETLRFVGIGRSRAEALIAFFLRQKGKRGSFWLPTGTADLRPVAPVPAGASAFTVAGEDAYFAYRNSDVFNVVAVPGEDGYQVNRLAGLARSGGNTVLTFRDPWAGGLTADTVISWCPRTRFATDRLEVVWETDTVARTQFSTISIPNEAP